MNIWQLESACVTRYTTVKGGTGVFVFVWLECMFAHSHSLTALTAITFLYHLIHTDSIAPGSQNVNTQDLPAHTGPQFWPVHIWVLVPTLVCIHPQQVSSCKYGLAMVLGKDRDA